MAVSVLSSIVRLNWCKFAAKLRQYLGKENKDRCSELFEYKAIAVWFGAWPNE